MLTMYILVVSTQVIGHLLIRGRQPNLHSIQIPFLDFKYAAHIRSARNQTFLYFLHSCAYNQKLWPLGLLLCHHPFVWEFSFLIIHPCCKNTMTKIYGGMECQAGREQKKLKKVRANKGRGGREGRWGGAMAMVVWAAWSGHLQCWVC